MTWIGGRLHADRNGIDRTRGVGPEQIVDALGEMRRRREIGRMQIQCDVRLGRKVRRNLALHRRAVRHATRARRVHGNARTVLTRRTEAAHHETPLRDAVDLAVDTAQRRHQQAPPAQARRVADGVHGHINVLARLRERRQIRKDGHGRHVLQLRIHVRRNRHAEFREHVANALNRERRLARLIARAIETDHETITDELVGTDARDRSEILHTFGVSWRCYDADQRCEQRQCASTQGCRL